MKRPKIYPAGKPLGPIGIGLFLIAIAIALAFGFFMEANS